MIKNLGKQHAGIGGLYFITTMLACSFLMFTAVRLSWASQAVAMADNLAYISAINVAVNGYMDHATVPYGVYNGWLPYSYHSYNPLADYNSMLASTGLTNYGNPCTSCQVGFDGSSSVVQFGEFKTALGMWVRPHAQSATVEVN